MTHDASTQLAEQGYAVIHGAVSAAVCEHALADIASFKLKHPAHTLPVRRLRWPWF